MRRERKGRNARIEMDGDFSIIVDQYLSKSFKKEENIEWIEIW